MRRIAFTGHRPAKLGGYGLSVTQEYVRAWLRQELLAYAPEVAISGMALGVDQWAAEECIALGIPFVAAVPFEEHGEIWPWRARRHHQELLAKAAATVTICQWVPETKTDAARCLQARNEWMVDNCSQLLAVWNGSAGGTANCVNYAGRVGRGLSRLANWPC